MGHHSCTVFKPDAHPETNLLARNLQDNSVPPINLTMDC